MGNNIKNPNLPIFLSGETFEIIILCYIYFVYVSKVLVIYSVMKFLLICHLSTAQY